MPCYLTVRIYQEEFDSIAAMRKAAAALGLRIEERGGDIWIGGSIKVTQKGEKYRIATSDESTLRSLMDEYAAAKVMREAERRRLRVEKSKARNGEITLKLYER